MHYLLVNNARADTKGVSMAKHRRNRKNRQIYTGTPQETITVSDNRALRQALADEYRNIRRLGYQVNRIQVRVSDISDNQRRKDTRNLELHYRRNILNRILRRNSEPRLNTLEKVRYMNLRDMTYDLPKEHPICKKRQERKEVMFATGKAGKGGQKPMKKPLLNIRCK